MKDDISRKAFRLLAVGVLLIGFCILAQGDEVRVGVYSGAGQKGMLAGLKDVEDIEARLLGGFSVANVSNCDVVVWPQGVLAGGDSTRFWRVLLKEYVKAGGGLILTHDAAGGYRNAMKDDPLYPEIARIPGQEMRKENKRVLNKVNNTNHPLGRRLPEILSHAYYDHMAYTVGSQATVLMIDEDGDPVVVAGEIGKGRVVIMGNCCGLEGTSIKNEKTRLYSRHEKEAPPAENELKLLVECLKWAGETSQRTPVQRSVLQAAVDAAAERAIAAETVKKEPVCVFKSLIKSGKSLDKDIWEYEPNLETRRHWGFWHSVPVDIEQGDYVCQTYHANKILASCAFERSPIKGKFIVAFDAILSHQHEHVGILDIALLNDGESGYGVELVYIRPDDPLNTETTYRDTGNKPGVRIGNATNAITSFDKGEKKILTSVEGDKIRLRRTGEGYARIPVRLDRSSEGELTLSMDGTVVARVKDTAYDNFTRLVATSPTPNCHVAFDNPKIIGYFPQVSEDKYASTPWVIPEPKEMVKNGERFLLTDGAQFVVSEENKVESYLLEEWIIPEIAGYYGVTMKAVTPDKVDESKPAIYLGEASDPAFREIFDSKLRALNLNDPGAQGYGIVVTKAKAQAAGVGERGTFYALQSLVQLMERKGGEAYIRGVQIKDWPDFELRAVQAFLWSPSIFEDKIENIKRHIRMLARYKANGWYLLEPCFDFPSYDLRRPRERWTFKDMIETSKYAHKYHLDPMGGAIGLTHPMLKRNLPEANPTLWQWVLDHQVLGDPSLDPAHKNADALNPVSPEAWQLVKAVNEDIMNAIPEIKIMCVGMDEASPPLNTHAPERSNEDLMVEWIKKHHKLLADRGVRMMMYADSLIGKDSQILASGRLPDLDPTAAINRIPKDIILIPWYYGDKPDRPSYKYLKDKGFDVLAMCGPASYGDLYNSAYYAANEAQKAGIFGITRFAHHTGQLTNPQRSVSLPYIYGWTVPKSKTPKPEWNWQEHWQDVYQGPLPSHLGAVEPLDIASACNESRIDERADDGKGWLDYGKVADLRGLPPGQLGHRQYKFYVIDESVNNGKSVVMVVSKKGLKEHPARRVRGIPVGEKVKSLVFLHTSTSRGGDGFYQANYEDGTIARINIRGGQNIGPWIYTIDSPKSGSRWNLHYTHGYLSWARLIPTGRTAMGEKTGLYIHEWANPYPERKVISVDMELTCDGNTRVGLVALSAVK